MIRVLVIWWMVPLSASYGTGFLIVLLVCGAVLETLFRGEPKANP